MVKLRKGAATRRLKTAYTRKSKKREKSYVRGTPYSKIVSFDLGNKQGNYDTRVYYISKDEVQLRHNALEAARVAVNKVLATKLGESNYHMKIRTYPHQIVREHALAAGAGADRFSSGMAHSFGKPIGLAARIKVDQIVIEVRVDKKNVEVAKEALNQARYKFPMRGRIIVEDQKIVEPQKV
jgi:large subunit ribosomal protein L10e